MPSPQVVQLRTAVTSPQPSAQPCIIEPQQRSYGSGVYTASGAVFLDWKQQSRSNYPFGQLAARRQLMLSRYDRQCSLVPPLCFEYHSRVADMDEDALDLADRASTFRECGSGDPSFGILSDSRHLYSTTVYVSVHRKQYRAWCNPKSVHVTP